jgi:hypothetical protein
MMEIARWLEGLGLDKYSAAFADAEIEFDVLPVSFGQACMD